MKTATKFLAMLVARVIELTPWASTAYVAVELVEMLIG